MLDNVDTLFVKQPDAQDIIEADNFISSIVSMQSRCSIGKLLLLLDDDYIYDEVMYSLIHAAEDFEDETYVTELLADIVSLCNRSPQWTSVVVLRSLNSDKTRAELVKQLKLSPVAVKSSLELLLNDINNVSPELLGVTLPALNACKN